MVPYLGDFKEDDTVYIPFNTFTSDDPSASCTITDLADADIKVHKDGSVDEIATDGATIAINFDSVTGNHLITIDTSADAAYAVGSDYLVRINGTTIDGATVNAWVGMFSIENRWNEVDVTHLLGTAWLAPGTAGTPDVNAKQLGATAQTGRDIGASVLLSSGTGTGQLSFASGVVKSNLSQILGTALTETAGYLAAGFKKLFNIETPVLTMESVNQSADNNTILAHTDYGNAKLARTGADSDTLETLSDQIDGCNTVVPDAAGVAPTAAEIKTAMEAVGSHLALIKAQTDLVTAARMGALTDLIDGERLDLLIDAIKAKTDNLKDSWNDITAAAVWDLASALTLDFGALLERIYEILNNKITVVDETGAATLRNVGDTGTIATGGITDAAGTTTRSELSWV